MFSQKIYKLNSIPDNIVAHDPRYDDTLALTTIILLYSRVENPVVKYQFHFKEYNPPVCNQEKDTYRFEFYEGPKECLDEFIKMYFNEYEALPVREKFLEEKLSRPVRIRLNGNIVYIFTTKLNMECWHAIQAFIPRYFPIFKEKPLTNEEKDFLSTLTYKDHNKYVAAISKIANCESFRTYCLSNVLAEFEKKMFKYKRIKAEQELNGIESKMKAALAEYREACNKRLNAIALLDGLTAMENGQAGNTELQEYLAHNKQICDLNINGDNLRFVVKTYLIPHHAEEWDIITRNGSFYSLFSSKKSIEDRKLLLDAIFSENACLKLKICAKIELDYFGSMVNAMDLNHEEIEGYIPNRHLAHHNCFGQNITAILDQLKYGDAVGAIECVIACVQRENIHEFITFRPFVEGILNSNSKILVADGKEMTPDEAIEYLRGKNA